jgi:hypothetical protein
MKGYVLIPTALLAVAVAAGPARAQDQTPPAATASVGTNTGTGTNQWIASGVVGSTFARSADSANVDFGGTLGYLWNGMLGAEFLAGFAPRFTPNTALSSTRTDVNNYMVNAVAALPIGDESRVQPFLSGGVGALTLSVSDSNNPGQIFESSQSKFGGNIGGGIMAFMGSWGIRGDLRYFSTIGGSSTTLVGTPSSTNQISLLNSLSFWRANIGVAFRW